MDILPLGFMYGRTAAKKPLVRVLLSCPNKDRSRWDCKEQVHSLNTMEAGPLLGVPIQEMLQV